MSQHKFSAQKRKEKKKYDDNERRLHTLFQVGMKGENVGGCREQESLYRNAIETNKETNPGACTNMMDIDINSEPGPDGADKHVD